MPDWNWFYSALAQSSAAIVGFFGGFVISKVIGRDSEYHSLQEAVSVVQARIQDQGRKLDHRYFSWYNGRRRESIRKSTDYTEMVWKGSGTVDLGKLRVALGYSPFDSPHEINSEIQKEWGSGPRLYEVVVPFSASFNQSIDAEREAIDKELISTEALITDIRNLIGRMISFPRGTGITKISLLLVGALFLIGVIFPLALSPTESAPSFSTILSGIMTLPAGVVSPKGVLLAVVSLLFFVIVLVFWRIDSKQSFSKDALAEFEKATVLSYYSPYFANYEQSVTDSNAAAT